jgi:hypothetical protein
MMINLCGSYFEDKTNNQSHKISRIHIRKLKNKKHLFEMNYKNFLKDDLDIENVLSIGSRYVVKADISNCFPSIYTHSIPWALVGKESAKKDKHTTILFLRKTKGIHFIYPMLHTCHREFLLPQYLYALNPLGCGW